MSYHKFEDQLEEITVNNLNTIELQAKTLSLGECYDYLLLDEAELSDSDKKWCKRAWKCGRAKAISDAGKKMFEGMSRNNGGQTAMAYLEKMSGTFKADVVIPDGGGGSGFSFNVTLTDDNKKLGISSDDPMNFGTRKQ